MPYYISVVNGVSSNPCVGLLRRIKLSFLTLSTWADEFISATNIIMFLLNLLPSDNEKIPLTSNPVP